MMKLIKEDAWWMDPRFPSGHRLSHYRYSSEVGKNIDVKSRIEVIRKLLSDLPIKSYVALFRNNIDEVN
jgi:hypothetical protein